MTIKSQTEKPKNKHWSDIRQVLSKCSSRDLLGLIAELYDLSNVNRDFLEARFLPNDKAMERYKAQIKKYLAPSEPWKSNQPVILKEAKKAISDYKKATNNPIGIIDLMVYYVECGTNFTCEFGDIDEPYYNSLESVFENALKLMKQQEDKEIYKFVDRLKIVVKKANIVGWGYYDGIKALLEQAYPDF